MDPFSTLGIEARFDVDLADAEKRHRELSRALHPDKFAGSAAGERQMALSRAVEVNDAWRVVRDPIRRAEALFALGGVPLGDGREPQPSQAFLMDVLEQREALSEARVAKDPRAVAQLETAIRAREERVLGELSAGLERAAGDALALERLLPKLGELRFFRRFLDEVSAIEDELAGIA